MYPHSVYIEIIEEGILCALDLCHPYSCALDLCTSSVVCSYWHDACLRTSLSWAVATHHGGMFVIELYLLYLQTETTKLYKVPPHKMHFCSPMTIIITYYSSSMAYFRPDTVTLPANLIVGTIIPFLLRSVAFSITWPAELVSFTTATEYFWCLSRLQITFVGDAGCRRAEKDLIPVE